MVAVAPDDPSANVVYSKVVRGVPSDDLFSVTNTGIVNVVGNLDREIENTYDVQIQVRNLDRIQQFSSKHIEVYCSTSMIIALL